MLAAVFYARRRAETHANSAPWRLWQRRSAGPVPIRVTISGGFMVCRLSHSAPLLAIYSLNSVSTISGPDQFTLSNRDGLIFCFVCLECG